MMPTATAHDLYLFSQGSNTQSWRLLGAFFHGYEDTGTTFRVWAPNADRVAVVGDFNGWDSGANPLSCLGNSGVWEGFVPQATPGAAYKFDIRHRHSARSVLKADPYARLAELRPRTASVIAAPSGYPWADQSWMDARASRNWLSAPMNIYEIHAGSWMRHPDGRFYSYRELAHRLPSYVADMGCTHVEFMPIMEHPLDESWGYQCTGFFAPTRRFGEPDDLKYLIDACHQAGLGVILDWVPGHFPKDDWALAEFDGTSLYEHEDPRQKNHPDWGTLVFNFGRCEVKSFLLSSAHWWLHEYHVDGLRVDAVASMLYLDYSRLPGQWLPNCYGGRENLDAVAFLRAMNTMVHREFPGAVTIAEESTAWPLVSRPVDCGGLGFSMKWNMGWMNDTLDYMQRDPIHRRYHHDRLTFGQLYAYNENFVLPFSHDEVVHGKGALWAKMPGDEWQRCAHVRLMLTLQAAMPGKKLNFMGNEIGQRHEWRSTEEIPWSVLQERSHAGIQSAWRDLNHLYKNLPALHERDFDPQGFSWIDCHDTDQSVISWLRFDLHGGFAVIMLNFTPVTRFHYRMGLPQAGRYRELFNSDSTYYAGSGLGNAGGFQSEARPWMGYPVSAVLTLPPLSGIIAVREQ
jgi:1,4-alpha-glucan branching enzyme